jgi:chemotaxis protein histidine kinase CheA
MFQASLETIRIDFKRTLGSRLSEIRQNMLAIETGNAAQEALQQIKASAHKFRGTATTLGFTSLGVAAVDLEDCIRDFENPGKELVAS